LSVLSGVRLELRGSQLRVVGSDLDLTIGAGALVSGERDGVGVLNAKLLTDIVRALPEGRVTLEIGDDRATISGGRSTFHVPTLSAMEFPKVSEPTGDPVPVPTEVFAAAVRQVVPAASSDPNRPLLGGVQIEAEDDGVKLVATDSYRLAVRDLPGASILGVGQSVLVPRNALHELLRMLGDSDELVLRLGEREASFTVGDSYLVTRLIEGQFPTYRTLIPDAHPNRLTVNRTSLIEAVKRVKVVARDASTPVRLTMDGDALVLRASTQDYGDADEAVDASFDGETLDAAFNPDYLISGAEAAVGDEIILETIDGLKPALLRSPENPEYRYVLMPVRI
jgi:DNA polymerase-3 subunit beta